MLQSAFFDRKFLTLGKSSLYNQTVKTHTIGELKKDLFGRGDLSTQLLGDLQNKMSRAQITAKSEGVLAGMTELIWFLKQNNLRILNAKKDGDTLQPGDIVLEIEGKAKNILKTERVGLNLLQRMSGIATVTKQNVTKLPNHILLAGTRKTLWGLLDKKAITLGGGYAHRLGLWHAILIKDNHLKLDSAENLLKKAWFAIKKGAFLEIEADSEQTAIHYAEIIQKLYLQKPQKIPVVLMLDNFKLDKIENIAKRIKEIEPRIFIEISGGINPDNLAAYGKLQHIDLLSSGFLTHSAIALDLSLNFNI